MQDPVLDAIRTRRVARSLSDQPIERGLLERILDAGRWAPSAGNHRPQRFVVIEDPLTLRVLRLVSPGMFPRPGAVIVICRDQDEEAFHKIPSDSKTVYIDVGTAAENMALAAHAIGLGAGPVTSFSKEAVRVVLNLPQRLISEMFLCLGYPVPVERAPMRPWRKITWRDLTYWERFPPQD